MRLIMLGTGHAMVTKCYNTCFVLQGGQGSVLVDAGGGNGILTQVERAGLDWQDIRALVLTHAHTDHILGGIWVLRNINSQMKHHAYEGSFRVYGAAENLDHLQKSCAFLLNDALNSRIEFIPLRDGARWTECGMEFESFDIRSVKKPQLGFRAVLQENGRECVLVCMGDEPCNAACERYAAGADWLLLEAFCLKSEAERFRPYEKNHSTAWDAGRTAEKLGVKNLVLYHTEDSDLKNRAERYTEEAAQSFGGRIFVPDDLEELEIL